MLNHFDARLRLLTLVVTSTVTYVLLPNWMLLPTRLLLSWDVGVIWFLILAFVTIDSATPQKMRRSAQRQDDSRLTILTLVVAAACARGWNRSDVGEQEIARASKSNSSMDRDVSGGRFPPKVCFRNNLEEAVARAKSWL